MSLLIACAQNSALLGILALFASIIWMLRDERDRNRPWLVFAIIVNLFYGTALKLSMGGEGRLFPVKYDFILFHLDTALGISSASVARFLGGPLQWPLWLVYQLMIPMMICWLLINRYGASRGSIILAYVAELICGPLVYAIVPACGPIYAFRHNWLHPPQVPASVIPLAGEPNGFPSLHLASALVLVFFAPGKVWRVLALLFLAGTAMATLSTGEHYVVDLFAGLAFGCFAAFCGFRRFRLAAAALGITLLCSVAVRFGHSFLLGHPLVVRLGAILILAGAGIAVAGEWSDSGSFSPNYSGIPEESNASSASAQAL